MSKKLFILLFIKEAAALSISNCGTDNTLEVVSGTNNMAVCSGLAGQRVEWEINLITVGKMVVGFCEASRQCTNIEQANFIASRPSDTESSLTIITKLTLNETITCRTGPAGQPGRPEISCFIDTVIPAEGSCTVEFRRTPWIVFSQCNITRMYSARGRYSCQWYQIYKTTTETQVGSSVSVTPITPVGDKIFAGSCVLPATTQMPRIDGSYSYRVIFIPGRNNVTATFIGTNEILRPILPAITCSNKAIVPENTTITCSCETSNIGKPGGRLKFSKLYGAQTTPLNAGNYDLTRLDMTPQIVNRNDDGRLQFRCDVEWAETITGSAANVSVGYVNQSVIKVNNLLNLSVAENQEVIFTCSAEGKPTPSMSLINKGNGTVIRTDKSPLTHTLPAARCEDTFTYSCLASNGMGKSTTSDANLYVNCSPRLRSDGAPPVPLFKLEVLQNQTESKQFDVVAYPTPNKFAFTFIGITLAENINSSDLRGLILNATCHERQELYISECTITAFNDNSDGGFYVVTVANAQGSVDFTFEVAVNKLVLSPCNMEGTLEFVEGSLNKRNVTCSGLQADDDLTWTIVTYNKTEYVVGHCSWPKNGGVENTCADIVQNGNTLFSSMTSYNQSVLLINTDLTYDNFQWATSTLYCKSQTLRSPGCQLDQIYPAEVSSCIVQFKRDTIPWSVSGQCNITRAYSKLGRYMCQWYQTQVGTKSETTLGAYVEMKTQPVVANAKYVFGFCELPADIRQPTVHDTYRYTVNIIPGHVNITAVLIGPQEIWRPSEPTVQCSPSSYVPENSSVQCTCTTQSVGVPGGRLRWSQTKGSSAYTVIKPGIYDDKSLDMTSPVLSRSDHEITQFRCEVEWAEIITGGVYTVRVGYAPSQSQLKLNSKLNDQYINESEPVTFECEANGRPAPIIKLINLDINSVLNISTSLLSYNIPAARCEDTATYACIASNQMGEDKITSLQLFVNCRPRGSSMAMPPEQLNAIIFNGRPAQGTFNVTAYPAPNISSITYLGSGRNACESETILKGVVLNATCSPTHVQYITTCTLTIYNVTSVAAYGFYKIRVDNAHGFGNFVYELKESVADPSPTDNAEFARGAAVGAGVTLAVAIIVNVLVLVWLRKRTSQHGKTTEENASQMTPIPREMQQNNETLYNVPEDVAPAFYSDLRIGEIEKPSSYERLDLYENQADI